LRTKKRTNDDDLVISIRNRRPVKKSQQQGIAGSSAANRAAIRQPHAVPHPAEALRQPSMLPPPPRSNVFPPSSSLFSSAATVPQRSFAPSIFTQHQQQRTFVSSSGRPGPVSGSASLSDRIAGQVRVIYFFQVMMIFLISAVNNSY
jgi:hypothetical protein